MTLSTESETLLGVAELSRQMAKQNFAPYSHRNSPHKFTQDQLLTCLLLKVYLKTTYRGLVRILEASEPLRENIGLQDAPHYSTLKKFGDRADVRECIEAMLPRILDRLNEAAPSDTIGDQITSEDDIDRPHNGNGPANGESAV